MKSLSNDWNAYEIVLLLEGGNDRFVEYISSKNKKFLKRDGMLCAMSGSNHHEDIEGAFNDEYDRCYGTKAAVQYARELSKRARQVTDSYLACFTKSLHAQ